MIKILIADDSKIARKKMTESLILSGVEHKVLAEVENGVEAFEKFQTLKPNLIITDLEMPQMGGLELIEKIRNIDTDVSFIVISSLLNQQVRQTLKKDRFVDFVKKPIDNKILVSFLLKLEHKIMQEKKE